jgi:hypothetical protein
VRWGFFTLEPLGDVRTLKSSDRQRLRWLRSASVGDGGEGVGQSIGEGVYA